MTVAIPTIPIRRALLNRAIESVWRQTLPVSGICVAIDRTHESGAVTRNRAVRQAIGHDPDGWIALLDDDDEMLPHHVETLVTAALDHGVGVAWGWYEVRNGGDPLPADYRGRCYDPDAAHVVPITYVAKAELFASALDEMGGFQTDAYGAWDLQDQPILDHMVRAGGHVALPDTTWLWWHHGGQTGNTSGQPDRWTG